MITSFYFKYLVFSMMKEKTRLNIIKYNKYLQNQFGITLIDYKNCSGRYIIYDGKGKGKEYNAINNKLIFEGEYKNGNGIESHKIFDTKLFEGEYKNGKKMEEEKNIIWMEK